MPPQIVDANGREIQLTTLLGQGGEGAVYGISSSTEYVAKVYPKPLSPERKNPTDGSVHKSCCPPILSLACRSRFHQERKSAHWPAHAESLQPKRHT